MTVYVHKFAACSERVMTYLAIFATFSLMVLTTTDAIGRYFFNYSFGWIYDISEKYLMVVIVFMAASYGYHQGAQIRVVFLVDRLPKRWKAPLNYVVLILSTIFCAFLTVASTKRAIAEVGTGAVLGTVNLPLWPAYVVVPVGLFFMLVLMVLDLPRIKADKAALGGEDFEEHYGSAGPKERGQDDGGEK
jgi:TRAP-type transport system small permease protein